MSTEGLIKIRIILVECDWHQFASETLWTEPIGDSKYILRNSPCFAEGLSYGDTVYAENDQEDNFPVFKFVTERGGHSTYRIVLADSSTVEDFEVYIKPLNDIGCSTEGLHEQEFSVDVPYYTDISQAFDLLQKGEENGVWVFSSLHIGHFV